MRALLPTAVLDIPKELGLDTGAGNLVAWFGINSFENRCLASLSRLVSKGVAVSHVYLVDYPTSAEPDYEDRRIRKANRELASALAVSCGAIFHVNSVEAYASAGLELELAKFAKDASKKIWVIDISCLTKIHVVTVAGFLMNSATIPVSIKIAYTSPRAYGNLDRLSKQIGWNDVIIAPIAASANMYNEGQSRGLVIAGHESERLWSALNEIEPASGLLILGRIPSRPDITRLSEKINRGVIKHMAIDYSTAWAREVVDVSDIERLHELMLHEVEAASRANAPMILYPFGPKSLVLAAASFLLKNYPVGSWFVYPVPARYDLTYSEGSSGTYWFVP